MTDIKELLECLTNYEVANGGSGSVYSNINVEQPINEIARDLWEAIEIIIKQEVRKVRETPLGGGVQ